MLQHIQLHMCSLRCDTAEIEHECPGHPQQVTSGTAAREKCAHTEMTLLAAHLLKLLTWRLKLAKALKKTTSPAFIVHHQTLMMQASRLFTPYAPFLKERLQDVSARVSPVELVGCFPTGTHNCSYGELPLRQPVRRQQRVLPFQAGTFCLSARGLSPGDLIVCKLYCITAGLP